MGWSDVPQYSAHHMVVGNLADVNAMVAAGRLTLGEIKLLVVDDLDEMLARGSGGLVLDIVKRLPPAAQLCDDAWMPRGVAVRSSNRVASGLPWRSERVSALALLQR